MLSALAQGLQAKEGTNCTAGWHIAYVKRVEQGLHACAVSWVRCVLGAPCFCLPVWSADCCAAGKHLSQNCSSEHVVVNKRCPWLAYMGTCYA